MTSRLGLIVTDASPLITLAAAKALNCLTIPKVPVFIPDMVYAEVTRDLARLGADEIINWVRDNSELVKIIPTQVFAEYQALLVLNNQTKSRGRGEQSALEVLAYETARDQHLQAILIYEDNDIHRRKFAAALPANVSVLSTGDLLLELESAGKIQSADHILESAAARGRNIEALKNAGNDIHAANWLRDKLQ